MKPSYKALLKDVKAIILDVDGVDASAKLVKANGMVEKPKPSDAPTQLATPGRYVLKNEIFEALKNLSKGAGGE